MTETTTEMVDRLECDLMTARKAGEVVAYLVPVGEGYTEALRVSDALVARLRARDLTVKVSTARTESGLALILEDTSPLAAV
jgi:hypothetical protein